MTDTGRCEIRPSTTGATSRLDHGSTSARSSRRLTDIHEVRRRCDRAPGPSSVHGGLHTTAEAPLDICRYRHMIPPWLPPHDDRCVQRRRRGGASTPPRRHRQRGGDGGRARRPAGLSQPQVSKHLRRAAGGRPRARPAGRTATAGTASTARRSEPVHDWVRTFERTWNTRLDRLDDLLVELQDQEDQP